MVHNLRWHIKSIFKSLKKKKFKALCRFFVDSEYRKQIHHLCEVTTEHALYAKDAIMFIHQIIPGHSINYPEWVDKLVQKIDSEGSLSLEPIKIIWNRHKSSFMVVDGNHRFEALRKRLPSRAQIRVKLLKPKEIYENL